MSRSYKKTPWSGDRKGKDKKRTANHKVRNWLKRHPDVTLNGNSYRKIYESWDICDYGGIETWEQYWESAVRVWYRWRYYYKPFPDKKTEYRNWVKYFKTK